MEGPTITYVRGDATRPVGGGSKMLVHVCNDRGIWGRGFVLALSAAYPEPEREYRAAFDAAACTRPALGDAQFVRAASDLLVGNLVAQSGVFPRAGVPPIRYDALRTALAAADALARRFPDPSMHMPRIGTGLAGGDWAAVERVVRGAVTVPVFVYDL